MRRSIGSLGVALLLISATAAADDRELVELPEMMATHMLANMRDHLATINAIMGHLARQEPEQAADVAEQRLGMSSLELHGAAHMAPFMPAPMRDAGTAMHRAASHFAQVVVEGDMTRSLAALEELTGTCVACHRAYRIR